MRQLQFHLKNYTNENENTKIKLARDRKIKVVEISTARKRAGAKSLLRVKFKTPWIL